MSTPTARQPKGVPVGGQFAATSHSEPGIVLTGSGTAEFVNDTHLYQRELAALTRKAHRPGEHRHESWQTMDSGGGPYCGACGEDLAEVEPKLSVRYPQTKSETRRLLKNSRGEADGLIRVVELDYRNSPDTEPGEKVEIVGPKDGRPIVVDITTGIPSLKVTSGTAIIRARSNWGNSIDVGPGAEAIIIGPADSKITTDCDEGGKVTFVTPSAKNRLRPFGKGEIYISTGTDTDRIPYQRPDYS